MRTLLPIAVQQGGPKFKAVGQHNATTLYVQRPGAFYGRGAYFSDNAAYSDEHFAFTVPGTSTLEGGAHRQLILARVLCGRTCDYGVDRDHTLVRPPDGCDSVRGGPHKVKSKSVHSCRMTVVYDRAQVYPQYIVTYRKVPCQTDACVADVGTGAGMGAGAGAGAGPGAGAGARHPRRVAKRQRTPSMLPSASTSRVAMKRQRGVRGAAGAGSTH